MNEANARQALAELGREPLSNLENACELYAQANTFFEPESPDAARCRMNEANARQALAELGREPQTNLSLARRGWREAAQQLEKIGSLAESAKAWRLLGRNWLEHDEQVEARAVFERGLDVLEKLRQFSLLPEARQAVWERQFGLVTGLVEVRLRLGDYCGALEAIEAGRSRTLSELLFTEELLPQTKAPELTDRYRRLQREAQQVHTRMSGDNVSPATRITLAQEFDALGRQVRDVEGQLIEQDPDFFAGARPPSAQAIGKLAAKLDRALVYIWTGEERGVALIVRGPNEIRCIDLPDLTQERLAGWMIERHDDDGQISGWLGSYDRYRKRVIDAETWMAQMDQTLKQLYESIMGPVHQALLEDEIDRIVLIAGGYLSLVPLHAAFKEHDGDRRYVQDDVNITYAPSAWILQRCQERSCPDWVPGLGVADPQGDLPFSQMEVERIRAAILEVSDDQAFLNLVGSNATDEDVLREIAHRAVGHLSCHAAWNPIKPLDSAIALANQTQLTIQRILSELRLSRMRLVVLSACESANGFRPGSRGEEYLGLPAAFILAGAKSVVGSLWAVLDPPTALLMSKMYEHLLQGEAIDTALKAAQDWLRNLSGREARKLEPPELSNQHALAYRALTHRSRRPFEHPYYWAAFGVYGSADPLRGRGLPATVHP